MVSTLPLLVITTETGDLRVGLLALNSGTIGASSKGLKSACSVFSTISATDEVAGIGDSLNRLPVLRIDRTGIRGGGGEPLGEGGSPIAEICLGTGGNSILVGVQFSHIEDFSSVQSCFGMVRGGDFGGETNNRPHRVHRSGLVGPNGLLELVML